MRRLLFWSRQASESYFRAPRSDYTNPTTHSNLDGIPSRNFLVLKLDPRMPLISILWGLLQNILEKTIVPFFGGFRLYSHVWTKLSTKSWLRSLDSRGRLMWWEKMIRTLRRSPSPGLSKNCIKINKSKWLWFKVTLNFKLWSLSLLQIRLRMSFRTSSVDEN